jgi:hypothetical protein
MDKILEIQRLLTEAIVDMKKFLEGGKKNQRNNAAGKRVRRHMLTINELTTEIRKEIIVIRKSKED